MLEINRELFEKLKDREAQTFYLYEVEWGIYDSENLQYLDKDGNPVEPLRFSNWDVDVISKTDNGYSYTFTPFAIQHNEIQQSSDGRINDLQVTVGNADKLIQTFIEEYDMVGNHIKIYQVYFDPTNTSDPVYAIDVHKFMIKDVATTSTQATFTLSLGLDFLQLQFPSRRMFASYCSWRFKESGTCNYSGSDTSCSKTWDDCKAKGNQRYFGGFPGIINTRFYI